MKVPESWAASRVHWGLAAVATSAGTLSATWPFGPAAAACLAAAATAAAATPNGSRRAALLSAPTSCQPRRPLP